MTILADAWQAGIDAVVLDPTLNRGGFVDAIQTVINPGVTNAEGNDFVDGVAAEFNRLGIIPSPTYNNLRNNSIIPNPVLHRAVFDALPGINTLLVTVPVLDALLLMNLRDERDSVNDALARYDVLIAAEPNGTVGRFVKDGMRDAKRALRLYKESVRSQIRAITGDPDST